MGQTVLAGCQENKVPRFNYQALCRVLRMSSLSGIFGLFPLLGDLITISIKCIFETSHHNPGYSWLLMERQNSVAKTMVFSFQFSFFVSSANHLPLKKVTE